MIAKKKEYEREIETLHTKVKSMQREIGSLTKRLSKTSNGVSNIVISAGGNGSQDESAANSPASSS